MLPVNQFILGGDSMLNSNLDDIDSQIQRMELYRQRLKQLKEQSQSNQTQPSQKSIIWDQIDQEINPMTDEQKNRLLQDQEYITNYNELQNLVQMELLNLVKAKIENTDRGQELLKGQLKRVKQLKSKIIDDTNREMQLFKKFQEYSKSHTGITYEEFLKENV